MTGAERLDDAYPHGTVNGYRRGCRGAICPAVIACRDVYRRYQGDFAFRRAIDAGTPLTDILAADTAAGVGVAARDRAANRARRTPTSTPTPRPASEARTAPAPGAQTIPKARPNRDEVEKRQAASAWRARLAKLEAQFDTAVARLERVTEQLNEHRAAISTPDAATPTHPGPGRRRPIDDDVRRLHAEGLSDIAIGRQLGISNGWIGIVRKRLQLPTNYPRQERAA